MRKRWLRAEPKSQETRNVQASSWFGLGSCIIIIMKLKIRVGPTEMRRKKQMSLVGKGWGFINEFITSEDELTNKKRNKTNVPLLHLILSHSYTNHFSKLLSIVFHQKFKLKSKENKGLHKVDP